MEENARIAEELAEEKKARGRLETDSFSSRPSHRLRVVLPSQSPASFKKQQRQLSIKEHPKVILAAQVWLVTALATRTPSTPLPDPEAYQLGRPQFVAVVAKVFKALHRTWDEVAARDNAIEEWNAFSRGHPDMSRSAFVDYLCKVSVSDAPPPDSPPLTHPR